jgi:hypothetical protein
MRVSSTLLRFWAFKVIVNLKKDRALSESGQGSCGGKSWLLVTKVVVEMLSGPKECENLFFFASFRRDVDATSLITFKNVRMSV